MKTLISYYKIDPERINQIKEAVSKHISKVMQLRKKSNLYLFLIIQVLKLLKFLPRHISSSYVPYSRDVRYTINFLYLRDVLSHIKPFVQPCFRL